MLAGGRARSSYLRSAHSGRDRSVQHRGSPARDWLSREIDRSVRGSLILGGEASTSLAEGASALPGEPMMGNWDFSKVNKGYLEKS